METVTVPSFRYTWFIFVHEISKNIIGNTTNGQNSHNFPVFPRKTILSSRNLYEQHKFIVLRLAIHCAHNRNETYSSFSLSLSREVTRAVASLVPLRGRDPWNPVEPAHRVARVRWPRILARNFVFSYTAVKMLIDNCVAPLATPPLLQRLLHLSCHPPPPVSTHAHVHGVPVPVHLCVYPVFGGDLADTLPAGLIVAT